MTLAMGRLRDRRKEAAKRGKLRASDLQHHRAAADPTIETAEIRFDPLGGMTFVTGSISHARPQHDPDPDAGGPARRRSGPIKFIQGDTDACGSAWAWRLRSTTMSGGAIVMVSDKISPRQEARGAYSGSVGSRPGFQGGRFTIAAPTAASASTRSRRPRSGWRSCRAAWSPVSTRPRPTRPFRQFPNGAHVCEVEIDPDTGATQLSAIRRR